ncbi:ChaN family lipoprotein [Wenxinia marina]|nr:ChaN family lipoprotein [Wenxinia marina]
MSALSQEGADIVVLGEVHDSAEAHARQAELVAEIVPAALVFEMLTADQVAAAEGIDLTDADALAAAFAWADSGWPDFALYSPIFAAAPEAALYGGSAPRDLVTAVATHPPGAANASPMRGYDLPPLSGADRAVLMDEQFEAHCRAMPREMMGRMVDAQRLRDWWMADAALLALEETGGPVVVIAGTGHARADFGVPAVIAHLAPGTSVWTLGQVEGAAPPGAPFDSVEAVPPVDRPNPCAAFAE